MDNNEAEGWVSRHLAYDCFHLLERQKYSWPVSFQMLRVCSEYCSDGCSLIQGPNGRCESNWGLVVPLGHKPLRHHDKTKDAFVPAFWLRHLI